MPILLQLTRNRPVGLPTQLLVDLWGFGSGMGEMLAKNIGTLPRKDIFSIRNAAIALARQGRHWLGPRALNELLIIATDEREGVLVREEAVGALARAVRNGRAAPAGFGSTTGDRTQETIRLARLLLREEDPLLLWKAYPALFDVRPDAEAPGGSALPQLAWRRVNEAAWLDRHDVSPAGADAPKLLSQCLRLGALGGGPQI